MGFFGIEITKDQDQEVSIPEGFQLRVTSFVLLDPSEKGNNAKITTVFAKVSNEPESDDSEDESKDIDEFAVCHLDSYRFPQMTANSITFTSVDSPIGFRCSGDGKVHITGNFERDITDDDSGDEDAENYYNEIMGEESESEEMNLDEDGKPKIEMLEEEKDVEEEKEEPAPKLVEAKARPGKKEGKNDQKNNGPPDNKTAAAVGEESSTAEAATKEAPKETNKQKKKRLREEAKAKKESGGSKEEKVNDGDAAEKKQKVEMKAQEWIYKKKGKGVKYKETVVGEGSEATSGKEAQILYEGTFPNGKVFDKNFDRKSPFTFTVGQGSVVKGMDIGVEGMKVGGHREIYIPSKMGYGDKASGPVPKNQDLVFHVQLIGIK